MGNIVYKSRRITLFQNDIKFLFVTWWGFEYVYRIVPDYFLKNAFYHFSCHDSLLIHAFTMARKGVKVWSYKDFLR